MFFRMNEKELNTTQMKQLFQAMSRIETPAEAKNFLRDVCTLSELKAMAERLQVAEMVDQETPYRKINKETGVSTATITRVAHWLHHGLGGYKMMLDRLKK